MSTIEQKVSDSILQKGEQELKINEKTYRVAKPSVGTIIMVSELSSTIPQYSDEDKGKVLTAVLSNAKNMRVIGKIIAVMILGSKRVLEHRMIKYTSKPEKRHRWKIWGKKDPQEKEEVDVLAEEVIHNCSPEELAVISLTLLEHIQIGHFFSLTTSLMTTNVLKPTKDVKSEVVKIINQTTQSGQ